MITLRQEELKKRLGRIRVFDRKSRIQMSKDIGIALSGFHKFWNGTHALSDLSLDKLEFFIMQREKELGL